MRKRRFFLWSLPAFVLCGAAICLLFMKPSFAADSEDSPGKADIVEEQVSLELYGRQQLTLADSREGVKWESSDPEVVTVEDGLLRGVGIGGPVTITASEKEGSDTCVVYVKDSGYAPVLALEQEQVFLKPGDSFGLGARLEYAGQVSEEPAEIHWRLADGSGIVSLEQENPDSSIRVTAQKAGEARILVSAEWNGIPVSRILTVYVAENDTRIEISGLELEKGGYKASLPLCATEAAGTTASFTCRVYEKGSLVEHPQLSWTEPDSDCVRFDREQLTLEGVREGKSLLQVSYKEATAKIYVDVYRPVAQPEPIEIETVLMYGFRVPESIEGQVNSVTIRGEEFLQSYDGDTSLVTIKRLPSYQYYGEQPIEIETDRGVYRTTAGIYTKILRTKEDLDQLGSWAHMEGEEGHPDTWGGYFVLGNDIAYNGKFQPFCDMEILGAMGECSYGDGNLNGVLCCFHRGFCGVFDGRGYNIDGMEITDECGGFLGVINKNGVFKNVSFTNARHGGAGGFICAGSGGTIENVYIHCVELKGGRTGGNLYSGFFLSTESVGIARVENCFVVVDCEMEDPSTTFIYGRAHEGYGILKNCVAVGVPEENGWILNTAGTGARNDCRVYENLASLKYSGESFLEWGNEFWSLKNGLPYPARLTLPKTEENLPADQTRTARPGGALRFDDLEKNTYLSLDEQAVADGAYIDGTKIMLPAKEGAVYTAYIRSIYEPGKKAEITIQVQDEPEKNEIVSESGLWGN